MTRILPTSTTLATGFTLALRTLTHIHALSRISTRNLRAAHVEGKGARGDRGEGLRRGKPARTHPSSLSLSLMLSSSRLSSQEGAFYRIRNSTVRVQPIIWFIPEKRVCVRAATVKGKRDAERSGGADTIGLESLSFPIAPLNLSFFPFSSLLRASPLSSLVLSPSLPLSCALSTSTLHHFPRSFLVSCNLCLGGAQCSTYAFS